MFATLKKAVVCTIAVVASTVSGLAWSGPQGQPMFYDGCLPDSIETLLPELKVPQTPASFQFYGNNVLSVIPSVSVDYGVTVWRAPCPENPARKVAMMKFTHSFASPEIADAIFDVTVRQRGAEVGKFKFRTTSDPRMPVLCGGKDDELLRPFGAPPVNYLHPPGSMLWWDSPRKPILCTESAFPLEPAARDSSFDVDAPFELTFAVSGGASQVTKVMQVAGSTEPGDPIIAGDQRGVWWNPEQSGWALAIDRNDRGVTFASWITYDEQGRATWYVMPAGVRVGPNTVEGPVFHPTGPRYDRAWNFAPVNLGNPVGKFRIEWTHVAQSQVPARNDEQGIFTFDVNGVKGSTPIRRFLHTQFTGGNEVCSGYRGMMWNPEESGWGLVLEGGRFGVNCPTFAAWLTYGTDGRATWFVMPNGRSHDEFFRFNASGALYQPSGPALSPVFDPRQVVLGESVGSLAVSALITVKLPPGSGRGPVEVQTVAQTIQHLGVAVGRDFEMFKPVQPMRFEF